ncbi:phage tail protein [Lactiplantibacillus plantarum]|nr:phage tail protein [Lactiplantibacillus plantarum]
MAESNATQVILTDDGIKIINAQNTADSAASQAENANSATLIAQSTANAAKSAADSTYDYASSEMAVHSMATAKAQSAADNAFSQAQTVFSQADSEIAVQSTATAKAQSTADNAFSQATTAIDNGKVTSQAVTDLKDGSKLTIAELENGLATKVANSEYASYQTQTASQIASKVDDGAFSAYKQTTADLISSKVATSDFSSYKDQTAKSIDSKVATSDFNTYKTQTADLIDDKVSNSAYASDKKQTASEIADRVSNSAFSTYQEQTASQIASKVDNGDFSTYKTQTAELISSKVATKDFSAYQATTAKSIESKVESSDFNTYKTQTDKLISSKVSTVDFNNLGGGRNYLLNSKLITITPTGKANYDYRIYLSDDFWKNPDRLIANNIKVSFTMRVQNALSTDFNSDVYFGASPWYANSISYPAGTTKLRKYKLTYSITDSTYTATNLFIRFQDTNKADNPFIIENVTLSIGSNFVDWSPAPEDQATQSQITQLSGDINLRVTKDDLIDEINLQAGNTLISSSGQLTLAADTIYFDTKKPVIIPSANITGTLTGKNINLDINGLINSPYTGIEQSADQYYHPWKLNTGQLTIGQGYITSVSSGTRSINGVPKHFDSLQGTLSASYLKFTNDYGARTYIDADMFTYSNQTNDTAMVTISAGGVGINMGTMSAPALTISNGYIDASSSSSYGVFGAITLGYSPHTINSDSSLFFESGHGSGNPGINIWAKGFHSLSSRLSTKRQVRLLDDEHSNSLLLGADTATFQYNQDTNADNPNEGVIIDDVNTAKQYSLPDELMTRDGKAPTDLMSFIARVISQNKYQARLIEDLQIRLRKVEINNG